MKLKGDNRVITLEQPKTILTTSVAAAGTTLTVKNNEGFAQNDFALIGKIGEEKTEIKRITAAVVAGTSLTVSACTFAHDEDTTITKVDYDQIAFYNSATTTAPAEGTYITNGRIAIQPSEVFTYFEDTTNTTGYGFVRYYDSNGATYSVVSDAISYSTMYTDNMLRSMRKKIRRLIGDIDHQNYSVSDEEIDDEINTAEKQISHKKMWSFLEDTYSISTVADQWEYSLSTSMYKLYQAKFDTQPLAVTDLQRFNSLRWDSDTTGDPTHICAWQDKIRVYPYPSSGATADELDGDITATATTIALDDASSFSPQGRVIIGSEVIEYTGIDDDTDLTGCTRAVEGTTAATHSDADTVTERDILYYGQKEATKLADETDTTNFPDPDVVVYKVAAELALGVIEDEPRHDRLMIKYKEALSDLMAHDQPKIKGSFGIVKNLEQTVYDEGAWRDPNDPPTGLSAA